MRSKISTRRPVRLLVWGLGAARALGAAVALLPRHATPAARAADDAGASAPAGEKNIVETAVAAGKFKTLAAALKAAGLIETLEKPGPFTVFAPTDDAFAKLPAGTVEELLKPENKEKLTAILTYHVVPGKVLSKDITSTMEPKTVNGKTLTIEPKDGKVMVDDATVIKADVQASNGVIHVIDKVLMP